MISSLLSVFPLSEDAIISDVCAGHGHYSGGGTMGQALLYHHAGCGGYCVQQLLVALWSPAELPDANHYGQLRERRRENGEEIPSAQENAVRV